MKLHLDPASARTHSAQALDPYSDMKLFDHHNKDDAQSCHSLYESISCTAQARSLAGSRLHNKLIMLCMLLLLAGCVTQTTSPTKFYILNALESTTSPVINNSQAPILSINVASLHLPQYLERPQIVTRSGGNRLELAEYDQWGGSLRKNMTRVLARNFSYLLATPNISISPNRPAAAPDFRVEIEVMQFERGPDEYLYLSAQWRVTTGINRTSVATQITNLKSAERTKTGDYDAMVASMSSLFGQLSTIIAKAISE